MDPRTQYIAYLEDLAKRNVDIAHTPATKGGTRFFLELNYEKLMGWNEPANKGWNMVLMGYETKADDNRRARRVERVVCVFDILKHAKNDPVELQEVYTAARAIGEELLQRFKEHTENPCDAEVSAGIIVPYSIDLGSKQTVEVGPRWNDYYGYRFSVDVMMDEYVMQASDPAKWRTP